MDEVPFGEADDDDGPGVWIIEERAPLRERKIFVDYDERAMIAEYLEASYVGDREKSWEAHDGGRPGDGAGQAAYGRRPVTGGP